MKVLVTLGNRLLDDGSISDFMRGRLEKTLEVADKFDLIVVTGGVANPKAGKSEGSVMREWLLERGVADDKIVVEDRSTTTKENAKFCREIFERLGITEVTVLSSAYHIERKWLNPVKLFKRYAKVNVPGTIKS